MKELVTWKNYLNTGRSFCVYVNPLNEEEIDKTVRDNIPHGNYRIYRKRIIGTKTYFNVIYVGRVADRFSDRGLKDRLMEHIEEWSGSLYFECEAQLTALAAYKKECIDYHNWKSAGQAEYNDVHPAKLPGSKVVCPVCGE